MSLIDREKTMEEIPIDVCDGFEVTDIIEKIPEVKAIPLDKVKKAREEIQKLRGCSCSCSDGIIDDVEDILDKLIESEDKE